MNADVLRDWVIDNDILNRTLDKFWKQCKDFMTNDWSINNPFALLSEDKLTVDIKEISVKILDYSASSENQVKEIIEVKLDLYYLGLIMGYFNISYDFSGNEVSNELMWGLAFAAYNQRISILEDLVKEFENNLPADLIDSINRKAIIDVLSKKLNEEKNIFK